MKGWLDKYQDGGPVTKTKDDEVVGFLKNLITPEVTRSNAPANIRTASEDQSLNSKIWDVVSHPVTAFKHLVNEGRLPNNFAAASPLGIDTALDVTGLNPLGYASLFHDMGASTLNLVTGKGSLGDLITLPVTGLAMLPGVKTAANIVGRHMEANSNFYSPIFNTIEKGANKIGSKVKQVDQKLGEKVFTSKGNLPSVPDIDPSDLESLINYNLNKGQGIKKLDLPINVKVNKAENVAGNYLTVNSMLDGKKIGSVILEQNLNPFKKQSLSRGVIDAIYPKGNAWANTPGFKKISDYPFSSIDYRGQIEHAGTSYNYNDLINSGVSGELNKAINETLKANNLGNIISGGTGHSTLGKKRWDNLVSKGHAENLGPGKYKLKENGGWLDKYQEGGVAKTDATRVAAPALKLTKAQLEKNKAINKQVMVNTEKANAKKLSERKNAMAESNDAGVINPNGKRFAIGDKFRMFPNGELYSGDTNHYGEVIDEFFNPAVFTGNVASGLGNAMIDRDAGAFATETAMALGAGALGFDPLGGAMKAIPNTYKINPWAYKPAEGMMFRGLGEEGYQDALQSGVFRSKQNVEPSMIGGLNMAKSFGTNPYFTPKFKTAESYGSKYLAEVPESAANWRQRYKRTDWSQVADRAIPINEGRILQKDWLQGYKPVEVPNINTSSTIANPIAPINKEALKDAYGFLERRQFVKGLQKQGLIGREFGEADARYAARSTDKTNALTKLVLDADATYYRGVKGSVPKDGIGYQDYTGRKFNMSEPTYGAKVSEFENMRNAGVDFNNPLSIAEYQASHVPMQEYGYRSGMPSLENVDAIYTSKGPNTYGNYQMRMTLPRDYSEGNYSDWVNKYIKPENNLHDLAAPKGYWEKDFIPDAPYETPVTLDSKNRSVIIGPRGKKMFDVDKTYPYSDYKNLTGDKLKEYKEYLQKGVKDFNTGFRGQYKNGGWLDKYQEGGEVEKPQRTDLFNQDTLSLPKNSYAKYVTDKKKSRLKGTSDDEEIDKAADWLTNWYSSKGAKQRLAESLKTEDPRQVLQDAKDNVNNVYVLRNYSRDSYDDAIIKDKNTDFNALISKSNLLHARISAAKNELKYKTSDGAYTAGFYTPYGHMINITPGIDDKVIKETSVHELTHASNLDKYYNNVGEAILKKHPLGTTNGVGLFPRFKQPKGTNQSDSQYIKKDGAYPRLMEMRYNSKINPNQVITPKQFEKIKSENSKNDLFRYYTDYNIINMLNHFAANDKPIQSDITTAEYGGELNYNDASASAGPGFQGDGYSNVGRNYSPAWGGQFQMGGSLPGATGSMYARVGAPSKGKDRNKLYKTDASAQNGTELENAYAKWPALRNMGPAAVNKDYGLGLGLGYGGVEFMHPNLGEVNYDNGVLLNQAPGKNSTTFNPLTDDAQSVRLDMLHGMHQDPTFSKHRDAFKQSVLSDPSIKSDMDYWYKEDKKKGRAGDGREQWMNNYIDGQMRTLLFEGDRKSRNYSDEEANQLLSNPKIKKNFNKLNDYLKAGYSYGQGPRADNGTEMRYYQEGLDFKPKSISKNGSVIKDDMGQWAHPGEITEIGSNQITMQGVPYPVMGISDTGDMQMMYPNEEYQYDGESVTEYPMMAQGGQLTKLDQLTNFTNYNTKQPGGWLDKYQ